MVCIGDIFNQVEIDIDEYDDFGKNLEVFPTFFSVHLRRFCSHISGTKNLPKARNSAFILADQSIGLEVDNQC